MSRIAGVLRFTVNGQERNVVGEFTYNLGEPDREPLVGRNGYHGFKEMPKTAKLEGEVRDASDLDLKKDILNLVDVTLTLELANGKTVVFQEATYNGSGDIKTDEASVDFKCFARRAEEIPA